MLLSVALGTLIVVGVVIATTLSTAHPPPGQRSIPARGAKVVFIGDSYTASGGAASWRDGYAYVVSRTMGWDATVNGIGGTGFTWGGNGTDGRRGTDEYTNRITALAKTKLNPDLVVLQGGQNDFRAQPVDLTAAVKGAVEQVRKAWPTVEVVVLGPSPPYPLSETLLGVNSSVRAGAAAADVPFIDAISARWFTAENSARYQYTDRAHLNTAGHAYLAAQVVRSLKGLTFPQN